ncbi:MAG: type II secretion system F family protein [Pseudomonadota bacterium]
MIWGGDLTWLVAAVVGGSLAVVAVGRMDAWMRDREAVRSRALAQVPGAGQPDLGGRAVRRLVGEVRGVLDEAAAAIGAHRWLRPQERAKALSVLERAGFRSRAAIVRYTAAKLISAVAACGAAILLGQANPDVATHAAVEVALVLGAAFAGGLLPEIVVGFVARRRGRAIATALPDALDLMIIVANSGQSLDMSLDRVAREMASSAPALSDELQVTMSELRVLANRREALENLARRTGLRAVRSFTATLIQTIQYGTPLSQALKVLADEMRQTRLLELEEQAGRLPAILSVVLMTLIMPSLFIVTGGPAVLTLMQSFAP